MAKSARLGFCLVSQAFLLFLPSSFAQVAGLFGLSNQGDGTYYQTTFGQGACSFAQGSVQYSPWLSGTNTIVAMNALQWFGSQTCGLCVSYQGLGPGAGANPIAKSQQFAIVGDLCPECKTGDLDLATTGDGRWTISWTPVQCNVGDNSFIYSFQGSNPYYLKLQIANTRVPVQSVSIEYNNVFQEMNRASDNYFVAFANGGQAFQLPTRLAITSVLGDTVYDTLATSTPSGNVPGTVQFPLSSKWDTVGGQSTPGTQTQPNLITPPSSPTTTTPAPTTPAPTTRSSPPPPAPTFRPAPSLTPSPTLAAQPLNNTPFVNQVPSGTQSSLPIGPYQQCGGAGASCLGAQCADRPYSNTNCSAGNDGTAFGCSRVNQYYWQCLPGRLAAVQNAGFQQSTTIAAPPSGRVESAAPCDVPIGNNQQCGGNGAFCSVTTNGAACGDQTWSGACCATSGYNCLRYSASYWECRPSTWVTSKLLRLR